MLKKISSIITSSGSYIPERIIKNEDFLENDFYNANKEKIQKSNKEITEKFEEITGIKERRYVADDQTASEIAYLAAKDALETGNIDKETLDYIIVAHNFGDVSSSNRRSDFVPSLAARVKHKLGIQSPNAVAYDIAFGCPGWLQGVIQADCFIKSGNCKKALVIGTETLSRISDPSDIDCMIYADGAGAVVVEAQETDEPVGIITHAARSDAFDYAYLLNMAQSYNPDFKESDLFLKMLGHKLYKYALQTVPQLVKDCLDRVKIPFEDIKKVLIHQANEKMDEEILRRLFSLYGYKDVLKEKIYEVMPMTISWLGNSSVATLPTLFDLMKKGKLSEHQFSSNELYVLASVGAGMNVNAVVYKMP